MKQIKRLLANSSYLKRHVSCKLHSGVNFTTEQSVIEPLIVTTNKVMSLTENLVCYLHTRSSSQATNY